MTPPPIGYMRAPPGRSAVRTPSTRRSSWRRSSSLTCTSRGTEDTRWHARWTWRSARWRSGSRTAGWKWRNRARTNQRTSAHARTHTPTHTYTHTQFSSLNWSQLLLISDWGTDAYERYSALTWDCNEGGGQGQPQRLVAFSPNLPWSNLDFILKTADWLWYL